MGNLRVDNDAIDTHTHRYIYTYTHRYIYIHTPVYLCVQSIKKTKQNLRHEGKPEMQKAKKVGNPVSAGKCLLMV